MNPQRHVLLATAPQTSSTLLPVILIPAYKPSSELCEIVRTLGSSDSLGAIIIVNDGSGPGYQDIFLEVSMVDKVEVLTNVINMGKGAALKAGLNYIACRYPRAAGVVTADADGQHAPADILRLAAALHSTPDTFWMGSRDFTKNVPFRSYLGNQLTGFVFACLTGRRLRDTQSGLRALPQSLIPLVLPLEGQKYDYEMSMLFYVATKYPFVKEIPIETIYRPGNKSSHFKPITDSAKIYYKLVQFYASSALASLLDLVCFGVAMKLTGNLVFSFLAGRILIATFVNFNINRRYVFQSRESIFRSLCRYYVSFVVFASVSFVTIRLLMKEGVSPLIAKTVVETSVAILSFGVQGAYVFREKKRDRGAVVW
jgi:putative flippase GtrA